MFIAGLILTFTLLRHTPTAENRHEPTRRKGEVSEYSPIAAEILAFKNNRAPENNNATNEQSRWWPPPQPWDIYWPTLGLVIATAFAVCAALRTLRAIEAQVEEMRKTGEQTEKLILESTNQSIAAKRSADALVNSERAWIYGELVRVQERDQFPHQAYALVIANRGKTPAQIVRWKCDFSTYTHIADMHEKSGESNDAITLDWLLGAGEAKTLREQMFMRDNFKSWSKVMSGEESGRFEYTVEYLDVVSGSHLPHQSFFAYTVEKGGVPERIRTMTKYK